MIKNKFVRGNTVRQKLQRKTMFPALHFLIIILPLAACSFDYGNEEGADKSLPDIVMNDVEYMRVRSGDPVARFMADQLMRFEERRVMELRTFAFEQFEKNSMDVNAFGSAGSAEVMIDSGDIRMDDGVRIEVESEDIIIQTKQLEWIDEAHTLSGGEHEPAIILRANGTSFAGIGFFADARRRLWDFTGGVSGTYIHDDDGGGSSGGTRGGVIDGAGGRDITDTRDVRDVRDEEKISGYDVQEDDEESLGFPTPALQK